MIILLLLLPLVGAQPCYVNLNAQSCYNAAAINCAWCPQELICVTYNNCYQTYTDSHGNRSNCTDAILSANISRCPDDLTIFLGLFSFLVAISLALIAFAIIIRDRSDYIIIKYISLITGLVSLLVATVAGVLTLIDYGQIEIADLIMGWYLVLMISACLLTVLGMCLIDILQTYCRK